MGILVQVRALGEACKEQGEWVQGGQPHRGVGASECGLSLIPQGALERERYHGVLSPCSKGQGRGALYLSLTGCRSSHGGSAGRLSAQGGNSPGTVQLRALAADCPSG